MNDASARNATTWNGLPGIIYVIIVVYNVDYWLPWSHWVALGQRLVVTLTSVLSRDESIDGTASSAFYLRATRGGGLASWPVRAGERARCVQGLSRQLLQLVGQVSQSLSARVSTYERCGVNGAALAIGNEWLDLMKSRVMWYRLNGCLLLQVR